MDFHKPRKFMSLVTHTGLPIQILRASAQHAQLLFKPKMQNKDETKFQSIQNFCERYQVLNTELQPDRGLHTDHCKAKTSRSISLQPEPSAS